MIIRSKAPLRLGLAGGGSDVSPYSDIYGGLILNATINMYAYCTIEETTNSQIEIVATDLDQNVTYAASKELPINGMLDLHKGVYNRIPILSQGRWHVNTSDVMSMASGTLAWGSSRNCVPSAVSFEVTCR